MLYVFQRNSTENHKGNAAQFALRRCMMFLNLGRRLRGQTSNHGGSFPQVFDNI